MLDTLTADTFESLLGAGFTLTDGALRVPVELVTVSRLGAASSPPDGRRQAFSLLFRGPASLTAPQRIYTLEHEILGALEIFFVPVQPEGEGTFLEAIFT